MISRVSGLACRLCDGSNLAECFVLDSAPYSVERLLTKAQLADDRPIRLSVQRCSGCGHVQLMHDMPPSFYDEYEMAVSYSPAFNEYLESLAIDFQTMFDLRDESVVEIGCGDGTFLEHLTSIGLNPVGVEPSRPFRLAAIKKGLVVHNAYIDQSHPAPGGPYPALICRQVLEHIPSVFGFLSGIRDSLNEDGVGLIEVPRLEKAVRESRFYDFFPDHLSYFSEATLARACERAGLDVVELRPTMREEYNTAFVRRRSNVEDARHDQSYSTVDLADLDDLAHAIIETTVAVRSFMEECRQLGCRVAVWGAGGKGVCALAVTQIDDFAYIVDSDPRKQGLYLPVSHYCVYPPSRLNEDPVDVVLVTALAHIDEIARELRELYGFSGVAVALGRAIQQVV
ncbi:MAG: hypothetical protein CMO26_24105 [Thiotrichales bacterium]|nr:hypothetical protein [Thiotrichales bacterium]